MIKEYKVLVLVEDYPRLTGEKALMFVHTRNKVYRENGIEVVVLNFRADSNYLIDGINVITYNEYLNTYKDKKFPILISHAANVRHHFKFIYKHGTNFKNFVFFFHGHEILPINKVYPRPYGYVKGALPWKKVIQNLYDKYKFYEWKKLIIKYLRKSQFIFVSNWMYGQFKKWINIDVKDRAHIIYNVVDYAFENGLYEFSEACKYDCITIRGNLDGSKYCIDIVNEIAKKNRNLEFLVVGKGQFFSHYCKAENIEWIDKWLSSEEIVEYLDKSKCALMPTKTDAQGLMMCEFASYGIPVITSDISVCREVLRGFDNIEYISNENPFINFKEFFKKINKVPKINEKFFKKNTIIKELDLLRKIIEER